jgi:hypothetical protein
MKNISEVALSGALMNGFDGTVTEYDQVQCILSPRSSSTLRFAPGGVQITTQGKKYRTGDELGHCFALSPCPLA